MGVSVTGQALAFLGAMALGGALGIVYDLFRLLRGRLGWRGLGAVLDLVYWPLAAAALFAYSVTAGDGVVRVYLMAGVALGGVLYFLMLSWAALLLGGWMADLTGLLWAILLCPIRWLHRVWKNFWKNAKKIFHYRLKWYRINCTIEKMGRMARARGGGGGADQKGGISHQDSCAHAARRFRRKPSQSSGPDRGGPAGAGGGRLGSP